MYNSLEIMQLTVHGNCEICKERIENTALAVKGVVSASWDIRTSKLLVTIESKKTDLDKISKSIAQIGYNTERDRAEDKAFFSLPDCCKYVPTKNRMIEPNRQRLI